MTNTSTTTLSNQVRELRAHYPELYEYLTARDRVIERALARMPSAADVELASTFKSRRYLATTLSNLSPGIAEIAEGAEHWPRRTQP